VSATLAGERNAYSVPFWVASDGAVVVFVSGRVVWVSYPAGRSPRPVTSAVRLAVVPLPRRVGRTTAPTDIPGLTFYLRLDDREGEGCARSCPARWSASWSTPSSWTGCGAARLRANIKAPGSAGLDLKDQLGTVRFSANQPFTICV
jgi:hypothetical protein